MEHTEISFEAWLDRTFGRAVTGESYPQFVEAEDDWAPLLDPLTAQYLTRLFENPGDALRYYSDRQIACGLWELGSGDAYSVYDRSIPVEERERLIGSVAIFFRDFFDKQCIPKLSHAKTEHISPLNTICYMWWEVINMGAAKDDPDVDRLNSKDLDAMEAVLQLPNLACKEAALHGLGHMVHRSDRALAIVDNFLAHAADIDPELRQYADAARTGCIQ